jgi:hypothetical protein
MFGAADRSRVRALLLDRAKRDERIVSAAIAGSGAIDAEDPWSDVDLAFAVADGADRDDLVADWTRVLEGGLGAVHHWDLHSRESLFRVFLLPDGLEVDISFTPETAFGAYTSNFKLLFGTSKEQPPPKGADVRGLIGYSWHHALHARASIERGKPWQAVQLIAAARQRLRARLCPPRASAGDLERVRRRAARAARAARAVPRHVARPGRAAPGARGVRSGAARRDRAARPVAGVPRSRRRSQAYAFCKSCVAAPKSGAIVEPMDSLNRRSCEIPLRGEI